MLAHKGPFVPLIFTAAAEEEERPSVVEPPAIWGQFPLSMRAQEAVGVVEHVITANRMVQGVAEEEEEPFVLLLPQVLLSLPGIILDRIISGFNDRYVLDYIYLTTLIFFCLYSGSVKANAGNGGASRSGSGPGGGGSGGIVFLSAPIITVAGNSSGNQ